MKKKVNAVALILAILILVAFAGMIVCLFLNRMDFFVVLGAILFGLVLLGLALKFVNDRKREREKEAEETPKE